MANQYTKSIALLLALLLSVSCLLVSCGKGKQSNNQQGSTHTGSSTIPSGADVEPATGAPDQTVEPDTQPESIQPEEPEEGVYEKTTETVITLGSGVTVQGDGATVDGKIVTVTQAGTYLISGFMADGQIVVDTADTSKVVLVLNGVSLACSNGPAVFVKSAPKRVEIFTAKDSVNILSDGMGYLVEDENQTEGEIYPNACIYACDDLRFDGEGVLYINGNADKGINTKDDIDIRGGTLIITSVGVGMRGNDSVTVSGGEITVQSGGDGVKSANSETEGKGQVIIENGQLYIMATGDGISAATDLTVSGGVLVITTRDIDNASVAVTSTPTYEALRGPGGGMPPGGGGFPGGMMGEGNSNKSSISAKGLKAVGTLIISGGKLTIDSADDGIHSDDAVWIKDGSLHITAADDGIHGDNMLTISGGVTEITQSYEGVEANQITISGGTNRITASDDGTNANGGSSMGMGGFWGGSSGSTDDGKTPLLTISGGYTVVNANGDGVDSNGNIVMTGGTMYVYGPTNNGNGPIDSGDGNYGMKISGGVFLAVGSHGMAEAAENDGQAVLAATMGTLQGGTLMGIKDKDGNMVAAFLLPKAISSVVYSSPAIKAGEAYTFVCGGSAGEAVDGVVDTSSYAGYSEMGQLEAY